jgi:hypothetical protein
MDDILVVVMVVLGCVAVFLFGLTVGQVTTKAKYERAACVEKCGTRQPVIENGLCGCVEAP